MRCLKLDESTLEFEELLFKAVEEYNTSVHSTTQKKTIDIFFGKQLSTNPQELQDARKKISEKIEKNRILT